jgi:ATP-dependent DNA ligase
VFDILRYKGKDVSQLSINERRRIIENLPIYNGTFKLTARYYKDFQKVYEDIVSRGGEGIIIKKIKGKTPYRGNTRNPYWYKIKKEVRISYIVSGFNISDCQSWAGEIKSIRGGLYKNGKLIEVCNIGSMRGSARGWFSSHKKEALGIVIECKGFEVFKSGALRHPSLIGIRDDVDPEECTFDQINRK